MKDGKTLTSERLAEIELQIENNLASGYYSSDDRHCVCATCGAYRIAEELLMELRRLGR